MSGFLALLHENDYPFSEEMLVDMQKKLRVIHADNQDSNLDYIDVPIAFSSQELDQLYHFQQNRYVLLFNGTIYNISELRASLEECEVTCQTGSDLEVLGALFIQEGVKMFSRLRGAFAILIWDRETKTLYGARDCFGMESLYYTNHEKDISFATDKQNLLALADESAMDTDALQHYLTYQYVPSPYTLTAEIKQVEAASYFVKEMDKPIHFTRYFQPTFDPILTERSRLMNKVRETITESVRVHMQSDQPLGTLLSGGVDSTIIASLAKTFQPNIKTFSVGFERQGFSEISLAEQTAAELGLENISYTVTAQEYLENLPKIMWQMGDPLADPACVPLYFVLREAKKEVNIVMSGEGADELFGGYNIYCEPQSLKIFESIPKPIKKLLHRLAMILPEGVKGKSFLLRGTTPLEERYIGNAKMFEEEEKHSILKNYNEDLCYQMVTRQYYNEVRKEHPVHQMQYIDLHTWLRGDILLKAKRMSQANQIELRSPFLDKEVYNVARMLPVEEKVNGGLTKALLRETFTANIPKDVVHRAKLGFPVPIRHWLKNEIYDWAVQLIDESDTEHILHKSYVKKLLERHVSGKGDYSRKIWTVLMFMLWYQIFVEEKYDFSSVDKVVRI